MDKTKNNKFSIDRIMSVLGRVCFFFFIAVLIVYIITVISISNTYFAGFAERSAYINFDKDIDKTEELAETQYNNLYDIADSLQYLSSRSDVEAVMKTYIGSVQFGDLRYFSRGRTYSADGALIETETSGAEEIKKLAEGKKRGCSDVYYDSTEGYCIAFFVPVRGSGYVDGILSIVPARDIIYLDTVVGDTTDAALLIDKKGQILSEASTDRFQETFGNDFFTFVSNFTGSNVEVSKVEDIIRKSEKATCQLATPGGDYIFAISPIDNFNGNLMLVSINESEGVIAPELIYIRQVFNVCIIAVAALILGTVVAVLYYRKAKSALSGVVTTDASAGCANADEFQQVAIKLLREKGRAYAFVILEIRQFSKIAETMSEKDVEGLLQYVSQFLETFCNIRETYGYLGDGRFVVLSLYTNERNMRDRVRLFESLAGRNNILAASKAKRRLNVGISVALDTRKYNFQEFMDQADAACERARNDINIPYVIYGEKLDAERDSNRKVETQMEAALANGEFKMFVQPKYNVAGDRVDSAEALVRWFDPQKGDYRFPGEFIGLFETNGFITKLDHFMYVETLKYLTQARKRGEQVVPISVNVSFVTASDPDFLEFYVETKKEYEVADGFVVLEFTETFSMGDYKTVRHIVDTFHKNGIRCSLDDFGTGYSSLGVIKNIPFDELKFDRMFIQSGYNNKSDDTVLGTLMSLAKSLGIRVVQEGVETQEMFDKVVANGCDVIQGYYYAKAISLEEFRLFIKSNTSIKYKSLVK